MTHSLRRTAALVRKEVHHIARDPQLLGFALLLPVVLLLLFGYAISFDIDRIPLVIVDRDGTLPSRELADRFVAGELFVETARAANVEVAVGALRAGDARAVLLIEPGFAQAMGRGEPARAQILLDGSDNNTASIALGYAQALAREASVSLAGSVLAANEPVGLVRAASRTLYNPGLRSALFIVPGLVAFICAIAAVMLTALTVAREYERGSMEQLFATPAGRLEIVLGKLLPYFALALVQVLLVVTAGVVLFGVPVRGAVSSLFVVSTLFVLGMLAQGLLISVLTRSQMVASQMAVYSTLLPVLLLSGFIFPVENMPPVLQGVAQIFPASHFVEVLRSILLRGHGLPAVATHTGAMAAWLAAMLLFSTLRFRRAL
jgi:ABC-2 type transport system permease protein